MRFLWRGALGVFNTIIPQENFVNYRSFLVQNCKYRVLQDFQYCNTAIFEGKYCKKNKLIPPYYKSQCPPLCDMRNYQGPLLQFALSTLMLEFPCFSGTATGNNSCFFGKKTLSHSHNLPNRSMTHALVAIKKPPPKISQ